MITCQFIILDAFSKVLYGTCRFNCVINMFIAGLTIVHLSLANKRF